MAFRFSISPPLTHTALCLWAAIALPLMALADGDKHAPVRYYVALRTSLNQTSRTTPAGMTLSSDFVPDSTSRLWQDGRHTSPKF